MMHMVEALIIGSNMGGGGGVVLVNTTALNLLSGFAARSRYYHGGGYILTSLVFTFRLQRNNMFFFPGHSKCCF